MNNKDERNKEKKQPPVLDHQLHGSIRLIWISRIALIASQVSIICCLITLLHLAYQVVLAFVNGPANIWEMRKPTPITPSEITPSELFVRSCLVLWISTALIGLFAGLLSNKTASGRLGLKRSVVLICLLMVIPVLLIIEPKA